MGNVYDCIDALCKERGISGSKMCLDLGMSKSFMTELKKGRAKSIKIETASKIADYFGVSVDYVLGRTDEKGDSPTVSDEEAALDAELIWRLTHLTPGEQREVDAFVQGLLASRGARTFRPASGE